MSLTVGEFNQLVAKLAPPAVAEIWDNVGLQLGNPESLIKKVLVALEISPATIDEAIALHANVIVAHHPLIFHPLKTLREDLLTGMLAARLIRAQIAVIAAHTNLDKSIAGPNYALAELLGAKVERWLRADRQQDYVKIVVFTPEGYEEKMTEAIAKGGGGTIGNYSHCTFRAYGTGTFRPLEGANPFVGEVGKLEETQEARLETLVPRSALANVLREIRLVHPYEEPALDVIPVDIATSSSGLGVVARLPRSLKLADWAGEITAKIRAALPEAARKTWQGPRTIGDASQEVQTIAICSGSGGSLIGDASDVGADCLLTGEIDHHRAIEARALGIPVIALGHFASEAAAMPFFAKALRKEAAGVEIVVAQTETDPMM